MVSADSYGIDYTGATDVRVALAAAINAQPPGTTFTLHAGGLYLTTGDAAQSCIIITAPGVTVDGLGAKIFRNVRRTSSLSGGRNEDMLQISAANVTVRNLSLYGFRKDEYTGDRLVDAGAGTPTVVGTTMQLNAQDMEVRLPQVGLDIFGPLGGKYFRNFETPFYFRQVDGLLKFEAVLSDTTHVVNDAVFSIIDDSTGATIYSQAFTLTSTPTIKTITFDPTPTHLGTRMWMTVKKAMPAANVITVTSITPYGEVGYRDKDMPLFNGGQEFSDAIQVNAVTGTLLEDIFVEGPDGDIVNCADADVNTVIRDVTGRGAGRQGLVMHKGVNALVEDCTFREIGRSGIDLEPNNVIDLMQGGVIRRVTLENIRNYSLSFRHYAKILNYTIEDITSNHAGMGPLYGGGRTMTITNLTHSDTYRTEADRIDNGGVDPALNGGAGADAQVFGVGMEITNFTTELGFQLPDITNNYNPGSGIITYHPSDIHIHNAIATAPYTTPFVYINPAVLNSSVDLGSSGFSGQVWDSSEVLWDSPVSFWDSGPGVAEPAFESLAFQENAFQLAPIRAVEIDQSIPSFIQSVAAIAAKIALVTQNIPSFEQVAEITVEVAASMAQSLPAFTQLLEETSTVYGRMGLTQEGGFQEDAYQDDAFPVLPDLPISMPAFTQTAIGGVGAHPTIFASIIQSIPAFTQESSPAVEVEGAITQTLAAFTQALIADLPGTGIITQSIPAFEQDLLGRQPVNGTITQSIPMFTQVIHENPVRWPEWLGAGGEEWPVGLGEEWLVRQ